MIETTLYLRKIAEEIVDLSTKPEGLQSILLQGSVAKGIADEFSDIELKFIWTTAVSAKTRADVLVNVLKQPLFAEQEEDGEWVSSFIYKSVKIDVSHIDMPSLQAVTERVMKARNTSIASQTLLASIQDSIALYGKEELDTLNAQFADYPLELSTRCIKVNASFNEWSMRFALLERDDKVALHHLIDLTLLQMLRLLYALNQTYIRSYNFKWIRYSISQLSIKPLDLENRIEAVITDSNLQALDILDQMLHEVFELIEKHRPEIELSSQLAVLGYTRQKIITRKSSIP